MKARFCYDIFYKVIEDYHKTDDSVDAKINNPFPENSIEHLLYLKNWIDCVQWHLEDIIRDPKIELASAIEIKRRIDASNQHRTDVVEQIDDYFLELFKDTKSNNDARLNSESPAWVVDRMSILCLKIYHMNEQIARKDVDANHIEKCQQKLNVLLEQEHDLGKAFEELLEDISKGEKYMKVYRQMKMYNDNTLNPSLYQKKQK